MLNKEEQIKIMTETCIDIWWRYYDFAKSMGGKDGDHVMVFELSVVLDRLVIDRTIKDFLITVEDMVPKIKYSPRSSYMELLEVDFNYLERVREKKLKTILDGNT